MQGSPGKQRQSIQDLLKSFMHSGSLSESLNTLKELNFQLSYCDDSLNKDDILLALLESDVYQFLSNMYVLSDQIVREQILDFFIYSLAINTNEEFNMLSKDLAMSTLEIIQPL